MHSIYVLLFLVLTVNSDWSQILWSYTLLLKLPVLYALLAFSKEVKGSYYPGQQGWSHNHSETI